MAEYRLSKRARACMACEKEFRPGDAIVSAIHESGEEFVRRDVCETCFPEAQDCYSHWLTREQPAPEDPHRLDYNLALTFLDRLLREADPARAGLAYVLALLLSRKRRLKIRETRQLPEGELLLVDLRRPEQDERVQILAPRLAEGEEDRLQADLEELFGFAKPAPGG